MTNQHTHLGKPDPVAAILWTGHNFPEVKQFFADWMPKLVADSQGPYNEPDEGWPTERYAYNTVQYYDGDDESVDPGNWIIVHTSIPEDLADSASPRIESLHPDTFRRNYDEVTR